MDTRVLEQVRRLIAPETDAIVAARARAGALHPPSPEVGALLRWAVVSCDARAVVEVGCAGGVSGLWIVDALADRGVLTSVEPDPHAHGLATEAFGASERRGQVRAILGEPATVLPRLSDGAYDVALLQGRPAGTPDQLAHVRRLVRPGGLLLCRGMLRPGDHGEQLARFVHELAEDPGFTATVLPVDDGLAIATRLDDPDASADEAAEPAA